MSGKLIVFDRNIIKKSKLPINKTITIEDMFDWGINISKWWELYFVACKYNYIMCKELISRK